MRIQIPNDRNQRDSNPRHSNVDIQICRNIDALNHCATAALNNYHPNIKLTLDEKPAYFLDTVVSNEGGDIKTSVHVKENKYPIFWSSQVPKRYKRNAINGESHRASKYTAILTRKFFLLIEVFFII